MIEIETGIPIPPRALNGGVGGRPPKYPWRQLQVGQSLRIDAPRRHAVHRLVSYWRKASGFAFTTRKIAEGQYRVWRVS